jgi:predicted naringenin-chalcone synthase
VLADCGNMSSATLPHIWKLLLEDPAVPPGTLIPSMAFGPGLTVCGAVLQKC